MMDFILVLTVLCSGSILVEGSKEAAAMVKGVAG